MLGADMELLKLYQAVIPGIRVVRKSDSRLMRVLDKLLFFVPNFMTWYTTVIGKTIYTPNGKISDRALAHEVQHIMDAQKYGLRYHLAYFMPQCLALLAILAIWWLPALLFLLFLLPIPSPGRMWIERRGYLMSAAWDVWMCEVGNLCPFCRDRIDRYAGVFSSWAYYQMWPFKAANKRWLTSELARIQYPQEMSLIQRILYNHTISRKKLLTNIPKVNKDLV